MLPYLCERTLVFSDFPIHNFCANVCMAVYEAMVNAMRQSLRTSPLEVLWLFKDRARKASLVTLESG